MKYKIIYLCILLATIFGNSAEPNKDYIFSEGYVSLEGGDVYPWGTIEDAIQSSLYGQGEFSYRYWENTYGIVQFGYTYFKTQDFFKRYPGLHQFHGRIGLEHQFSWMKPFFIGFGFTSVWVRADSEDDDEDDKSAGVTLIDNESEFGAFLKAKFPIWKNKNYAIGLNIYWDYIWTLPEETNILWIGLFIQRRLW